MTINWGIIGTGGIAHTFADDFSFAQAGDLAAVASRSQERADDFASEYNLPKAYGSYEDLAADKEIDVIYIATPHSEHYDNTMLCLEYDKAVLCEKPIAVNSEQLEKMIAKAKEKKLFLMEALWTYFLPPILKAKEWIAEGKIGEVKAVEANFGIRREVEPEGRLFNPELAGGSLLDVGIYPIALANLMIDSELDTVTSVANLGSTGVDEETAISLKFKGGEIAQLTSSIRTELNNIGYIYGTEGKIRLPDFWQTDQAVLEVNGEKEVFTDDRETAGYNYEAEAVAQKLQSEKLESDKVSLAESRKIMQVMDKVREQINLHYPFE